MASPRSLSPLGGWDLVARGRFETRYDGHVWTVDLDYFDFGERLHLYRDGLEVEVQSSPATFHLDASATIEASMSLLGMRRIDLIVEGEPTILTPVEGTAEGWRLQLARERPDLSRLIGAISWIVLVIALVYEVPQLIALSVVWWVPTTNPRSCCRERQTSYSESRRLPLPWSERCDSRAIAGLVKKLGERPQEVAPAVCSCASVDGQLARSFNASSDFVPRD